MAFKNHDFVWRISAVTSSTSLPVRGLWRADSHSQMNVDSLLFTLRFKLIWAQQSWQVKGERWAPSGLSNRGRGGGWAELFCNAGGLFNRRDISPCQPGRWSNQHGAQKSRNFFFFLFWLVENRLWWTHTRLWRDTLSSVGSSPRPSKPYSAHWLSRPALMDKATGL